MGVSTFLGRDSPPGLISNQLSTIDMLANIERYGFGMQIYSSNILITIINGNRREPFTSNGAVLDIRDNTIRQGIYVSIQRAFEVYALMSSACGAVPVEAAGNIARVCVYLIQGVSHSRSRIARSRGRTGAGGGNNIVLRNIPTDRLRNLVEITRF